MQEKEVLRSIQKVLANMPGDWLKLTTHRLDIYDESRAKTQFLAEFERVLQDGGAGPDAWATLPTAYDYIRLGHPLSSILEWAIAQLNGLRADYVISFSSRMMPVLAVLRKNLLDKKQTRIVHTEELPAHFDATILRAVYGYAFELVRMEVGEEIPAFSGSTILLSQQRLFGKVEFPANVDFFVGTHATMGSVMLVNGEANAAYIKEIQHVRRRESIAMTPADCHLALQMMVDGPSIPNPKHDRARDMAKVQASIQQITNSPTKSLVASSGLSMQYAIMMGLVHDAQEVHPGQHIRFIVPPNCYGGTNDQARRVAACNEHVEIVDLLVDGDNELVRSLEAILEQVAKEDAIPYIIAEIPTNPRVEVPDMEALRTVLSKKRKTASGFFAVDPVFILDQTFCPNVHFLGDGDLLSTVRTIAYVSGSKFPSGGLCTAGYCVGNALTDRLIEKIDLHLRLCDNEATDLQLEILAKQLPSMNQRIADAYRNTRDFVSFIQQTLPGAKINFVSDELAEQGFTPSVFALDLPAQGNTDEEREAHKRALNLKLIHRMITQIPQESKFCVSYGQLKGCYWTIPATSTQGTTKEGDKDYIVRVAVSPDLDLELHKQVFAGFVEEDVVVKIGSQPQ
ncbi:MAG: PLP-dependent transferase [Flavobacteriales bacterium]|nr:PLP-dependent transferase [Flavobacteriales bacterium]MBK9598325.1 PLP-dependent transferase [Flavobacteriales bacterium]QQS73236.1 MAG: PLP-dependent transferase [Flavobacteriales bacterium]HQV39794.1 PLP-dependent transferase [Flavobacteriales bacterium]HQW33018.1 PLP-dependent transferase [Flavobacteriales bacterium]